MATVPSVVGQPLNAALTACASAGLTSGFARQDHDTVPSGTVLEQSPVAGLTVKAGSPVMMVVSSGPPIIPRHPWSLLIGGVDHTKQVQQRSLKGDWTRDGWASLSFSTFDLARPDAAYLPNLDDDVILTVDNVVIYRGLIAAIGVNPLGGIRGGTKVDCTCTDYASTLDRVIVDKNYTGSALPGGVGYPILWTLPWANDAPPIPPGYIGVRLHQPHGWHTGQRVRIAGHLPTPPDPSLDGDYVIQVPANPEGDYWMAATFFIPHAAVQFMGGQGTARLVYSLKEVLEDLVSTYLTPSFGITLDSTMPPGPSMDPAELTGMTVKEAVVGLLGSTGHISRVLPTRVLQVFLPGEKHASFALDGSTTHSPIQWRKSRTEFANRIVLFAGGTQKIPVTETFIHTGTGNGTYKSIYPVSQDINDPWPNVVTFVNAVGEVVEAFPAMWGVPPVGDYAQWYWDYVNATLVQQAGSSNPAAGLTITAPITRQFPMRVIAEDPVSVQPPPAGRGPWEKRVEAPTVTDIATAQSLAQNFLVNGFAAPRELQLSTLTKYAMPGDTLPLTFPDSLVSGEWMVEQVGYTFAGRNILNFEYTFREGDAVQRNWIGDMKELIHGGGGSGAGGVTVLAGGSTSGGGGAGVGGSGSYTLAAARTEWVQGATWQAASGLQVQINTALRGSNAATVYVRLRARTAGVGVTARLWNVTTAASAGESSMVTATNLTAATFPVVLNAGIATYELQILGSVPTEDVQALGYLE